MYILAGYPLDPAAAGERNRREEKKQRPGNHDSRNARRMTKRGKIRTVDTFRSAAAA